MHTETSTVPVHFSGSQLFLCWPYLSLSAGVIEECLYLPLPLSVTANTSGQVLALLCHSNTHTDSAVGHATLNRCLGCLSILLPLPFSFYHFTLHPYHVIICNLDFPVQCTALSLSRVKENNNVLRVIDPSIFLQWHAFFSVYLSFLAPSSYSLFDYIYSYIPMGAFSQPSESSWQREKGVRKKSIKCWLFFLFSSSSFPLSLNVGASLCRTMCVQSFIHCSKCIFFSVLTENMV